ncbi:MULTISPECIES: hypothetical protein [Isoptericola]|uniref:hypothetical protein n=1 Tax=Isoptericola TaxID=254250 RepID=UPI000F65443A|nr:MULTISPECIES: hypothetical protein [Isoptericola]
MRGHARGRRAHSVRAGILAGAFAALFGVAVLSPWGQWADDALFGVVVRNGELVRPVAGLLREALPLLMGAVVLVLSLMALRRRTWPQPVTLGVLTAGSIVLSVALRDTILERPDYDHLSGYAYNTFPSTHATVAAALGLATIVLWPARTRLGWTRMRAVTLATVALACLVNVATFAHRPADVVGSLLLVACLASLVGAAAPSLVQPRTAGFHPAEDGTSPR